MEFHTFLKNAPDALSKDNNSVVIFQGNSYPRLFFTNFFQKISSKLSDELKTIDVQVGDCSLQSQLSTTFLGITCTYWLGDCSVLKGKQKEKLASFLMNYQGPHKVIAFFDNKTALKKNDYLSLIPLQDSYGFDDVKSLFSSLDVKEAQKTAYFLNKMYKKKRNFSLDEIYLLQGYQALLGNDLQAFCDTWMQRLVVADQSLFTLSQLFFERQEKQFFKMWLTIKPLYADMFWVSFWSEQIYRAYFFIYFSNIRDYQSAKKVSFGLPFSFMKYSFQQHRLKELHNMHTQVYMVDDSLKNGGHSYKIDQLFMQFFSAKLN